MVCGYIADTNRNKTNLGMCDGRRNMTRHCCWRAQGGITVNSVLHLWLPIATKRVQWHMENKIKLDSAYFVLLIAKEIICCHIPLKGSNMRFKTGCLPFKCMGVLWEVCYLKETTKICHFSKKNEIPTKFCPLFIIILLETCKMHILNVL